MERNRLQEQNRHAPETLQTQQPVDLIELISQDLPWEDLANVSLSETQLDNQSFAALVTSAESQSLNIMEHVPVQQSTTGVNCLDFNADDLSSFSTFANSLPSVPAAAPARAQATAAAAAAAADDDDVAVEASNHPAFGEENAGICSDLVSDFHEEDLDTISLGLQMDSIMTDLLTPDSSIGGPQNENEGQDHRAGEATVEEGGMHLNKVQTVRDVNSSSCTESGESREDFAAAGGSLWVTEQSRANGDVRCGYVCTHTESLSREEQCPGHGIDGDGGHSTVTPGRQDTTNDSNDDAAGSDDDEDLMLSTSQEWIYDGLRGHIDQQQPEATRVNSLRNLKLLPPPTGAPNHPPDRFSRPIRILSTKLELMDLDVKLMEALQADCPDVNRCCQLLDDYSPYSLSPQVLIEV